MTGRAMKKIPFLVAFVLLHCFLYGRLLAQPGPPPEVVTAQQQFQAHEYDSAIKTLEEYIGRNPATQLGWTLLGNSYQQKGNLDRALEMYLKAAGFRPSRWPGLFNAAIIYAL